MSAYKYFDYICPECGNVEERFRRDGDPQICKKCRVEMNRLVSAPGMVKGNFADKPRINRGK